MGGTKRRAQSPIDKTPPSIPLIDLFASPKRTTTPFNYPESALRSTQSTHRIMDDNTPVYQPTCPGYDASQLQRVFAQYSQSKVDESSTQHEIPRMSPEYETTATENGNTTHEAESWEVEDSGVYFINADEKSWSGCLFCENDPAKRAELPYQATRFLAQLQRADKEPLERENVQQDSLTSDIGAQKQANDQKRAHESNRRHGRPLSMALDGPSSDTASGNVKE